MSYASTTVKFDGPGPTAAIGGPLRALSYRRQLFRSIARGGKTLACVIASFLLIALIDYTWPLPRTARLVFLVIVSLGTFLLLARTLWGFLRQRTLLEIAIEIERAAGNKQNSLVTMAERLEGGGHNITSYIQTRLEGQALNELTDIDERIVAPREGAVRWTLATAAGLFLVMALRFIAPNASALELNRVLLLAADDAVHSVTTSAAGQADANAPISIGGIRVRVIPPAYSGLGVEEIAGDAPVRVLTGSQVEVVLDANGPVEGATLSFNNSLNPMRPLGSGEFSGTFTAGVSGAFEARLVAGEAQLPAPIVRAVEVYNDAPPEAKINEPVSDQLLRTLPNSPIIARWTARDDLGLAAVALKYIKSRGEGDSAKFTNGEVNMADVARESARDWHGAAALDLRRLDMQPGDTLVFWIEVRDRNPGVNNVGRSASLAISIPTPELAKLNLSDLMPNEIGRFLLSERQIILHTERLHNERARLAPDEFKRRANDIAAEQREFKNSFNDYINIEGEGESNEAGSSVEEKVRAAEDERISPHFHGIPEPPQGAPTSVRELTYAIRAMWDAEDALTNADTVVALKHEREALVRLKRAQVAVRYIPPIVAQSKPVDLKRRYAGELAEIKTRLEKLSRRPETKESGAVRAALADAYAALGDLQETLGVSVNARPSAVGRARERARQAADRLLAVQGGDHGSTIAEAAGQLRVVEVELSRMETGGTSDEFASRITKPLALLTQAASNLFAIAESRTRAQSGDTNSLLPKDDARAAEYFRRLMGVNE